MATTGVGERLRNARTARGLSLDDIEAATRIKRRYLDAIEREAWEELPAPAYARGFLGAYARQLGIPPDELLAQYPAAGTPGQIGAPAAHAGAAPGPVEVRITPGAAPSRLRRILTAVVAVLIAAAIIVTYVVVVQLRQFAATRPRPGVTAAPNRRGATASAPGTAPGAATPAKPPAATPPPSGQPSAAPAYTPPAGATPAPAGPGTVVVDGQATDRTWIRVVSDGSVVFEGFISAGDHQTWHGRQVSIRVGNASALDLSVNGKPIGRLGNPGDVVDRTFAAAPAVAPNAPAGTPAATPPATAPSTAAPPPPAAPPASPARAAPPAPPGPPPSAPRPPVTAPVAPSAPAGIPASPSQEGNHN